MPPNDRPNSPTETPAHELDATSSNPDRSTNVIAGVVFALLGAYVIWEAQRFGEYGAVTPVFVGVGLMALSLALIATSLSIPQLIPPVSVPTGSMFTRALLVGLMIIWVALLPYAGFLLSSIIAFGVIAAVVPVVSNWTFRGAVLHAIGAIIVTVLFWFILTAYLNVPLPAGKIF
ncbi:MAG: tripartite tricarboxylate transporter TctB family protein [Pseudomonadota bacterium]